MKVRVSDDLGNTWGEANDIGTPVGYLSRTHPIKLHNEWLVLPIYMDWSASSAITISKDGGLTWGKPKWIMPFLGIEPTVIQRSDLSLFALMRSGTPPRRSWQVASKDLGRNWGDYNISEIDNPGSALEMIKLSNGHIVLAFNNSKKKRYNLSLALSYDGGKTWPHIRAIEDRDDHVNAYPSIIQDRYGLIHVVYAYDNHQNVAHFVTDERWIENVKAAGE
jgi:predicted neuraminidase